MEVEEDETDDINRDLAKYKIAEKRQWTERYVTYVCCMCGGKDVFDN